MKLFVTLATFLCIIGFAQVYGGQFNFDEKFILSENREDILKELIAGTEDYYFYNCLYYQQQGNLQKAEELLEQWIKRYSYTYKVKETINRQILLQFPSNPKAGAEKLRERIGLYFNHHRKQKKTSPDLPIKLDQSLISFDRFASIAMEAWSDMTGFEDSALSIMLDQSIDADRRRHLLGRLKLPAGNNLPRHIVEDLKYRHSGGFGSLPIHSLLTLEQLDECQKLLPGLAQQSNFVLAKLARMQPGPEDFNDTDQQAKKKHLRKLWQYVSRLSPSFNSLKANICYHLLDIERKTGNYDTNLFNEYLKLPRQIHYVNNDYIRSREHRSFTANLNSDYKPQTGLERIRSDEELVRDYFREIFLQKNSPDQYFKYVDSNYLNKLFAECKITTEGNNPETYFSMLSPHEIEELKEKTELIFRPQNKKYFKTDDKVELEIQLKNINKLMVKLYELNTFNYYRENKTKIKATIELDGLIANNEGIEHFSKPGYIRHTTRLAFNDLGPKGVFVVELIGNGVSSRALICKGRLEYTQRQTSAGHILSIFDDSKEQIKDAIVWLDGRSYNPDKYGLITIPYSTKPGNKKIIITHKDFSSIHDFKHESENYTLTGGFYVDRESLIEGATAKVLFRPILRVNGFRTDVSLIKDTSLEIISTDIEGVSSTKVINNFELFNSKESEAEFKVPDKLSSIHFKVRGIIDNLSNNQEDQVEISESFKLNEISETENIQAFLPRKGTDRYFVYLLGLTGEPVSDYPVNIEVKNRYFTRTERFSLKTDGEGKIDLGPGRDIEWVDLSANNCRSHRLITISDKYSYPELITAHVSDSITLPVVSTTAKINNIASLFEKRNNLFYKDCSSSLKLNGNSLFISDLSAGDYELYLKKENKKIELKISAGIIKSNCLISDNRILESNKQITPFVHSINLTPDGKTLEISLKNTSKNTRVHLIASRFIPDFSFYQSVEADFQNLPFWFMPEHPKCTYLTGRDIGDEYKYILERKYAQIFPGNMLKRPGLLLNPWSLGSTETGVQHASEGGAWDAPMEKDYAGRKSDLMRSKLQTHSSDQNSFVNLNFIFKPSVFLSNLKPDSNGKLRIEKSKINSGNFLQIVSIDGEQTSFTSYSSEIKSENFKNLCMDRALDPERHFSEQKSISPVRENQNLSIDDITTAKIEVLDSLNSVFQLFKSINNDAKLHEFKFLPGWANLEKPRKLELYSKYSCHELNFFIYKKDPTFFNEVVKPYIAHKRDKTFMDKWLLNMDMKEWLNPWSFGRLNIVEKILLSQRIKEKRTSIKRHVKDLCDLLPKDEERFNFLFKIALKGSALDTGDKLAINEALAEPSMPPSPSMARKKMRLQRPASKPSASLRSAPKMELEEMAAPYDADMSFDDGFGASDEKERREITRQLFKQLEKTEEWVENNYYKIPVEQQVSDLITINEFWKDYALHEAGSPFLSAHIAQASNNFTEMALALAVIDLPFDAPDHKTEFKKTKMQLDPGCGIIAFHREIKPVREVSKTQSILTGQNFFALDDRYYYEGNERFDKFVTEEFLVRRVYGCQVVLTNPTSSRKNVDMLIQIPNGAIPVKKSLYTNSINMQLDPFSTRTSEYYFYFPEPGTQIHYPVHVSQEETMIVAGNPFIFNVVNSLTSFDKTAWTYVSENGTNDEVIEYLENNNIERLDLELTAFRLKEEKFFNRIYKLLKSRHTYNDTVWSYSIYHCNQQAISEYLEHNSFAENCGSWVASKLLNPDPIERHIYQHKEYKPLVNARVYQLGKKREILNKQFSKQYTEFLSHLKYKKSLSDYDRMALVYYMLLQDRIAQASEIFNQIKDYTQVNSIQYDYLNAYLAFSHEKPEKAIKIADKYKDFPVLRWQNLFKTVIAQAEEIQGNSPDVVDEKDLSQRQEKYASLQPELDFSIEKDKLLLNYNNISQAKVNIYQMDIELLFSKMPFVQELSGQFSVIKPNHSFKKELPENQNSLTIDIPETLKNSNLMVEVSAEGITRSTAHYPNSLLVSMFEEYGQLQIRHQHSKKPLSKVYIKVYGKMKNGETRFYKDGYTDLRGKFDYASLSTNELDNVERFAILISSESHGSLIKEASVPNR